MKEQERASPLGVVEQRRLPSGLELRPVNLGGGDLRKFFGLSPLPDQHIQHKPKLTLIQGGK